MTFAFGIDEQFGVLLSSEHYDSRKEWGFIRTYYVLKTSWSFAALVHKTGEYQAEIGYA